MRIPYIPFVAAVCFAGAIGTAMTGGINNYISRHFQSGKEELANKVNDNVFGYMLKSAKAGDPCLSEYASPSKESKCEIKWSNEEGTQAFLYVGQQKIGQLPMGAEPVEKGHKPVGKAYPSGKMLNEFASISHQLSDTAKTAILAAPHPDATIVAVNADGTQYVVKAIGRDMSVTEKFKQRNGVHFNL